MKHLNNEHEHNLKQYNLISKIFRFTSLKHKIFMVAFVATHIPLFCVIAYLLFSQAAVSKGTVFFLVLFSTLAGTAFVLWVLHHLLKPVQLCSKTLDNYLNNGKLDKLPTEIHDEMGELLKNLSYTLTVLEQRRSDLKKSSTKDHLTGLMNRLAIEQKITTMLNIDEPFCLALIDFDRFKKINDVHGHLAGDAALQQFGDTLKRFLNKHSKNTWAARWGGEEFLLIIPANIENSKILMNKLRIKTEESNTNYEGLIIKYTISIGLTDYLFSHSIQDNIKFADKALFSAKDSGRNKVVVNLK